MGANMHDTTVTDIEMLTEQGHTLTVRVTAYVRAAVTSSGERVETLERVKLAALHPQTGELAPVERHTAQIYSVRFAPDYARQLYPQRGGAFAARFSDGLRTFQLVDLASTVFTNFSGSS
jgi:hypothetical protein